MRVFFLILALSVSLSACSRPKPSKSSTPFPTPAPGENFDSTNGWDIPKYTQRCENNILSAGFGFSEAAVKAYCTCAVEKMSKRMGYWTFMFGPHGNVNIFYDEGLFDSCDQPDDDLRSDFIYEYIY